MDDAAELTIEDQPFASAESQRLVAALDAELAERYDPDNIYDEVDHADLEPGRGAFLIARLAGDPVGCGALRLLPDGRAEVKRMYVAPAGRRRGVASAVLRALEARALSLGATTIVLETGTAQPEAIALYERAGYQRISCWGEYAGDPTSVCFGTTLSPGGPT